MQRVFDFVAGLRGCQRLVVGKEIARLREVPFRLLVIATMNGVVGALEEPVLAVFHELHRRIGAFRVQVRERLGGHDDRRGDVVLHLELHRGIKILAHSERAP